jgi:O-antigen ligase
LLCVLPFTLLTGPFLPDLFLSIISIIFVYISIKKKLWKYYKNKFFYTFILFYFYILIRSIFSDSILLSFESSLFYFRYGIFALAVWFLIDNNSNIIKIFTTIILLTFIFASLNGLYQSFYGENIFGLINKSPNRLSLVFNDNLILGNYIVRLLPLSIGLFIYVYPNGKYRLLILFIYLILTSMTIYLSGERTALAIFILSILMFYFLINKQKKLKFFMFIVFIVSVISSSFFNPQIQNRNIWFTLEETNIFEYNNEKIVIFSKVHESLYQTAINIFQKNPIFGVGPKLFREKCDLPEYRVDINSCSTHPHNTYLQLLSETGIIGFLMISTVGFLILIKIFKQFLSIIQKKEQIFNDFQVCLIICFTITLFPFMPTLNFFNNWINIIYYLPVGFYLHSMYLTKVNNDK